ncbi:hypothetical protein RE428_10670 [Marinobacter nanhaiticus D15-8W]|nr:hypothetical protein RE428_10670 [Marinobacter nanhaiticus D15-8W]
MPAFSAAARPKVPHTLATDTLYSRVPNKQNDRESALYRDEIDFSK